MRYFIAYIIAGSVMHENVLSYPCFMLLRLLAHDWTKHLMGTEDFARLSTLGGVYLKIHVLVLLSVFLLTRVVYFLRERTSRARAGASRWSALLLGHT